MLNSSISLKYLGIALVFNTSKITSINRKDLASIRFFRYFEIVASLPSIPIASIIYHAAFIFGRTTSIISLPFSTHGTNRLELLVEEELLEMVLACVLNLQVVARIERT